MFDTSLFFCLCFAQFQNHELLNGLFFGREMHQQKRVKFYYSPFFINRFRPPYNAAKGGTQNATPSRCPRPRGSAPPPRSRPARPPTRCGTGWSRAPAQRSPPSRGAAAPRTSRPRPSTHGPLRSAIYGPGVEHMRGGRSIYLSITPYTCLGYTIN